MTLSAGAYIEKNKLSSTNAWLVLLKITMPNTTVIRIVANSENVTWPVTAGNIFTAFPFQLAEIGDTSKGEIPSISLKVSNAARILEPYLEAQDGLVDSTVNIYVVNSINVTTDSLGVGINNANPEIELEYEIISSFADIMWVNFTLGAMNPWNKRFPRNKVYKNICRYNDFKGDRCKYADTQTSCDRSLYTCRTVMLNSENFGGFPGVGTKGTYV